MTPVGLKALETAASVRSATMRFSQLPWVDCDGAPIRFAEVKAEGLPELENPLEVDSSISRRSRRLLRLGGMPFVECLNIGKPIGPLPLMLALPDTDGSMPLDGSRFLSLFSKQVGPLFDGSKSMVVSTGRTSGLMAVEHARRAIAQGQADFALAGGIDSFRHFDLLNTLESEGRLKTSRNLDGFIPGEASAFVLLATPATAATLNAKPLASISAVAEGFETGHLYSSEPYYGDGLAATIEKLTVEAGDLGPFHTIYSSMNGESHWGKEWGVACVRNQPTFAPDFVMNHPADCFGDVGAASGVVMVGLAALGLTRGVCHGPVLVYCSSDRGPRAALAIGPFQPK